MKEQELILQTSKISRLDRDKFKMVAKYKGASMTAQLRMWIRESYDKLPKEAK